MKILERSILAAGLATLAFLLWRFDPRSVWAQVAAFGLGGLLLIFPLQILDHACNVVAWRFAFHPEDAGKVSLLQMFYVRVAGDGVNYLTMSGTVAGELVRPGMLDGAVDGDAKNASVLVAKLTQALGQVLFIVFGILFVLQGRLDVLTDRQLYAAVGGAVVITLGVAALLAALAAKRGDGLLARFPGWAGALRERARGYLREHPGRFAASTFFFALGFAAGAVEVWVACRLLGVPIDPLTALAVEVLSNVVDSLTFMVPAKMGTQEAGKTAIFAALGLPAVQGLAFGLVRHVREFAWAGLGFAFYARHMRVRGRAGDGPLPKPASRRGWRRRQGLCAGS